MFPLERWTTLGTPLLAGRYFTWEDSYQKLSVGVISESFAREFWANPADALGNRIRVGTEDDWREIVGVVGDVYDDGVTEKPPSFAYWPLLMAKFESEPLRARRDVSYVIRSPRTGSESFMKDVRRGGLVGESESPALGRAQPGTTTTNDRCRALRSRW